MLNPFQCSFTSGHSRARVLASDTDLPSTADVIIIGGGVVGCCAALNLAERGLSVVLIEKGKIAGEASGRAAGHLEYAFSSAIKMPMIDRALTLWDQMEDRIDADIGYVRNGIISLFDSEDHLNHAVNWVRSLDDSPGNKARTIEPDEIEQLDPSLAGGPWIGALYLENASEVEPTLAAPAIAEAAQRLGAAIIQDCAVTKIVKDGGKISAVMTEKGFISAPNVVIAGGLWSPIISQSVGIEIPQMLIFTEHLSLAPLSNGPTLSASTPNAYFRKEPDGGYLVGAPTGFVPVDQTLLKYLTKIISASEGVEQAINPALGWKIFNFQAKAAKMARAGRPSPFIETRIFEPTFQSKIADEALNNLRDSIPIFKQGQVRERYKGALMSTLDNLGVLSPIQKMPGLVFASGFLYGLTVAPAVGEAVADLITGGQMKFDLEPYRHDRFSDGSPYQFYA